MSATVTFIPLSSRRFLTLDCEAGDGEHGLTWPEMWVSEHEDAFVKVRYTATAEQARRIDHEQIRRTLDADGDGAHNVWIEPTIVRELRARVQGMDETVSDTDAMTMWLELNANGASNRTTQLLELHNDYLGECVHAR